MCRSLRGDPAGIRTRFANALGIPRDARVVLSSFGGYGLDGLDEAAIRATAGYHVLLPGMIDENAMYQRRISLRRSGAGRRCGRDQTWIRNHFGVSRQRHGGPVHVPRRLSRVSGAGRCDAEVPAMRVHRSRRLVCRPLGARTSMHCWRSQNRRRARRPTAPKSRLICCWTSSNERACCNAGAGLGPGRALSLAARHVSGRW